IGENPRLSFFDVTKKDKGSIIIKRNGFKYKQIGAMLKDKLMESFIVDAPYDVKLLNQPVAVSTHQGQELTFILEGSLKVQIENHTVILNEGDSVVFDTEYPHGMIAVSENGCRFLAVMTNSI
ncbi:MAG: cupin domain-containing protein, partial [Oscillospiraceae bacterium]